MPRQAREKSSSGYYHILLRGIGKQNIFEDTEDREKFIEVLEKYKREMSYKIIAYCLMGNHIHLLIKDINQQLDVMMKKIAGSYAYYFNWKYQRVGHLFQDRFKSEPVEDDAYLLTVIRYIHQNPNKANISKIDNYPWSSYHEYTENKRIVDTEIILEMLNGIKGFIEFGKESEDKQCLDINDNYRLTDEKAIKIIKKIAKVRNLQELQNFEISKRNKILSKLKSEGLSIRQISRLTGINRGVVLNA